MLTLRLLSLEDREAFYKALNDQWEGDFDFVHYWESLAGEDFEKYVKISPGFSRGLHIPNGHVSATLLFAFNETGEIVGRTSIRHALTEHLLKQGGHIGYGVCPRHRRKGYATEILRLSLDWVKANLIDIDKVLVTCNEGNIGSQKTIENNNGELENIIDIGGNSRKMRYWISIN